MAERLIALETEQRWGAAPGERSLQRINHRNGYHDRRWETRAGTVDLRIPKPRRGRGTRGRAGERGLAAALSARSPRRLSSLSIGPLVEESGSLEREGGPDNEKTRSALLSDTPAMRPECDIGMMVVGSAVPSRETVWPDDRVPRSRQPRPR